MSPLVNNICVYFEVIYCAQEHVNDFICVAMVAVGFTIKLMVISKKADFYETFLQFQVGSHVSQK